MTVNMLKMTPELHTYMLNVSLREDEILQQLKEHTLNMPNSGMLLAPEQGQFLSFLLKLMNAKRTLEVGVFTGYSTLWTALALPADGQIVACDVNADWTAIGRKHWEAAGVSHKIDLRLAPATETLTTLLESGQAGRFDFAFIDADKTNYSRYYSLCMQLLRPGGLIAFDNVLWDGNIINPAQVDADTISLREINQMVHADPAVDVSLVPIGDGLLLARKR